MTKQKVTKRELLLLTALMKYADERYWTADGEGIKRYYHAGRKAGYLDAQEAIDKYIGEGV